jgi:hypothetical protein
MAVPHGMAILYLLKKGLGGDQFPKTGLSGSFWKSGYTCSMIALLERGFRRSVRMASVLSFAVATLIGCKPAPMTNTVVDQSKNPNGRSSAILIERYRHAALSANVFYVLIVSDNEEVAKVANNEDIEKRSALVATKASKVRLRYENPSTLLVTCDACGLEAIDIMQKLDHLGATSIRYQGFPQHTAYQ